MVKNCPNCGNTIDENTKFCPKCGQQIQTPQNFEQQNSNIPTQQTTPAYTPPAQQQYTPHLQKKSNKKVLMVIIAAIVIVVLVSVMFLLFFSSEEKLTGTNKAEDMVKDFINAYENEDWNEIASIMMNSDGSFYTQEQINSHISSLQQTDMSVNIENFKILSSEKLAYNTDNTDEIYAVTFEANIIYTENGETNEQGLDESTFYVAKNKNGKWGLSTSAFDISMDGEGDQYEPDNSDSSATILQTSTPQTHSIHTESDEDWYEFTLSSSQNIKIETSGTVEYDTEMYLYDSSLYEIDYNDDNENYLWSTIQTTLSAGTYYVKVIGYDNSETVPSYQIELTYN